MARIYGAPNPAIAGGYMFAGGLPGQVVDTSESVRDSKINNRKTYMSIGSTNATAGALYGGGGTLNTLVLSIKYNNTSFSSLTLAGAGNTATLAAFLAAIKAKTEWAGINAQIGGPNANQLVLSSSLPFEINVVGTSTANTALGLTAGVVATTGITSIDFGVAVASSPFGDDFCQSPIVDSDPIIGLSVRNPFARAQGADNTIDYQASYAVPILRAGFMWVLAAETAAKNDQVISLTQGNATDPVNGAIGSTTAGAAGYGRVAVTNCFWETATPAGQMGKVRIWK